MSVIFKPTFLSVIFAWILATGAAELPLHIGPDHPAVRMVGRFTADYRFNWSGCKIEIETDATAVNAVLEVVADASAGMTVVVDGEPRFLKLTTAQTVYPLAENLEPGRHRIELFKRSEATKGTVRFKGLDLSDGAQLFEIEPPERRLLAIGDSITCAYGSEAVSPDEGNTVENENGYLSYVAIAARELEADLMMVCRSGHGMFRNRSLHNDRNDTLPQLFERTLWNEETPAWDHSRYKPDLVVINLGSNDNATRDGAKGALKKKDFVDTYIAFIERLRDLYPDAHVVLSIGPMTLEPISDWLPEIADEFDNTSVLTYARFAGDGDVGGHWHPSVAKHKKMAGELVEKIETVMRR